MASLCDCSHQVSQLSKVLVAVVKLPENIDMQCVQMSTLERLAGLLVTAQQQLIAVKAEQSLQKGVANLQRDGLAGDSFAAAVKVIHLANTPSAQDNECPGTAAVIGSASCYPLFLL